MHSLCKLLLDYATCTVFIPSIRPSMATMMVSLPDVMILIRVNSVYEWSLPRTSDCLSCALCKSASYFRVPALFCMSVAFLCELIELLSPLAYR